MTYFLPKLVAWVHRGVLCKKMFHFALLPINWIYQNKIVGVALKYRNTGNPSSWRNFGDRGLILASDIKQDNTQNEHVVVYFIWNI